MAEYGVYKKIPFADRFFREHLGGRRGGKQSAKSSKQQSPVSIH